MSGAAQQGTWALRHGLEALSPARHMAQSAQRSLQSQRQCALSVAPLAPIVSPHALLALFMCKQCPMACVKKGAPDIMHEMRTCDSAYSIQPPADMMKGSTKGLCPSIL